MFLNSCQRNYFLKMGFILEGLKISIIIRFIFKQYIPCYLKPVVELVRIFC